MISVVVLRKVKLRRPRNTDVAKGDDGMTRVNRPSPSCIQRRTSNPADGDDGMIKQIAALSAIEKQHARATQK
jgi:hypothetical protein